MLNLISMRSNGRIRMYEDHGVYRVYNGMRLVCEADNIHDANIVYNHQ